MTTKTVDEVLGRFDEGDATIKLVWAVLGAVPGSEPMHFYRSLAEARLLTAPGMDDAQFATAIAHAMAPGTLSALKVADAIDTGDVGISVFTGLRSALTFFFGDRKRAFDTDAQQGADAALKALAIGWMAHQLFPGSVPEKVRGLQSTPSGRGLMTWYAAVEIALPFADDVAMTTGSVIGRLFDTYGAGLAQRLEGAVGAGAGEAASGVLGGLVEPLDAIIRSISGQAGRIAEVARNYLPPAIATTGTVAGAVATAADALPVYRLLGARLAAEAALLRARGA